MIQMRRRKSDERVERLRLDRNDELGELARKAARWAADNLEALRKADPEVPEELHDRATDNWRPLFAIANQAGGAWPERVKWAASVLSSGNATDGSSVGVELLADIRTIFADRSSDRLLSVALCDALTKMEDRPWPEWRNAKPITVPPYSARIS